MLSQSCSRTREVFTMLDASVAPAFKYFVVSFLCLVIELSSPGFSLLSFYFDASHNNMINRYVNIKGKTPNTKLDVEGTSREIVVFLWVSDLVCFFSCFRFVLSPTPSLFALPRCCPHHSSFLSLSSFLSHPLSSVAFFRGD